MFDGYPQDPQMIGTKRAERLHRTKTNCSSYVEFEETMAATTSKEKFFSNEKKKIRFISLLKKN